MKELSEMTLEELWQLFPIILKEHNPEYKKWYEIERKNLTENFKETIIRINHIGSTSVEGLIAKPTVDILMEIKRDTDIEKLKEKLLSMGWLLMNSTNEPKFRQTYNKGYTKYGFEEKVYHLHVRYYDDWNELYFRDYLREHKDIADEYAKLKLSLWKKYEHDRDGYTDAKTSFVLKITEKARKQYKNRYSFMIRYAVKEDYDSVENIMKQVQSMHVHWRPDVYKDTEIVLNREVFYEFLKNSMAVVAVKEEKVVGIMLLLSRHVKSNTQVERKILFVDTMAVDKNYRGQGIGHKFFDFAKKIVKQDNYDGLELQVNAKNKAAMEMYKHYGFTEKSINMELLDNNQ